MYLTMLDEKFIVMRNDAIIDADDDANVLLARYGSMPYVS